MITKRILSALIAVMTMFSFSSCESDNNDEPQIPTQEGITLAKIEGVWEDGDYFISFNSNKFCSSFIAPGFIDCGDFQLTNGVVSCNNPYFNKVTTYKINSVSDKYMDVTVNYTTSNGGKYTKTLNLKKTNEKPVIKENPIIGRSVSTFSSYWGTVTRTFYTYYSGMKVGSKGSAEKYPLNLFYVYRNGLVYQEAFSSRTMPAVGGWDCDHGQIIIQRFTILSNGTINAETVKTIDYYT